jgi:hypothetical protein
MTARCSSRSATWALPIPAGCAEEFLSWMDRGTSPYRRPDVRATGAAEGHFGGNPKSRIGNRKRNSHRSDSNRRPAVYKTAALPIELRWQILHIAQPWVISPMALISISGRRRNSTFHVRVCHPPTGPLEHGVNYCVSQPLTGTHSSDLLRCGLGPGRRCSGCRRDRPRRRGHADRWL